MNYARLHDAIILRARYRTYDSSIHHNHHIIPLHEDPSSAEVVPLTIKEHKIVHLLRYKMNGSSGNLVAYRLMKGKILKFLPEEFLEISSNAGKLGGSVTKNSLKGIFSDSWDRSAETKRRHEHGILTPYLKGNSQEASRLGNLSVQSKKGIHAEEYNHSEASKKQWESGDREHVKQQLRERSKDAGLIAKEKKAGFHGLSEEEKAINCSKGGSAASKIPMWTNGTINKRSFDCPGEDWFRGVTQKHRITKEIVVYKYQTKEEI